MAPVADHTTCSCVSAARSNGPGIDSVPAALLASAPMSILSALLGVLVLLAPLARPAAAQDSIAIGLMAPLTGAWASEGPEMRRAVELVAEGLNARGGVLRRKIELIVEDDGSDPRTAGPAAQKLVQQKVTAVIGTYGSAVTEAVQAIYDEAGIVHVANGSTAVRLTEKKLARFFRVCPRDDEQGRVAVQAILRRGARRVAILHDNTAYGRGLATEVRTGLEPKGTKVVYFDGLVPGEPDYAPVLAKIKAAGPDLVFFTGYYPEAGLLLRQKAEMKWAVPVMGGDANSSSELLTIAGKAAAGFSVVSPLLPEDLTAPGARAFLADYQRRFNAPPVSIYAVLAGDALGVLAAAMQAAGTTEPDRIASALRSLTSYSGLTGPISFDARGDRVGDVYRIYRVDAAGKFVLER